MIELYQDYIEKKLKATGVRNKIYKTMKDLTASSATHIGAVIVDIDTMGLDKRNTVYEVGETKIKRIRKYSRLTKLNVIIGDTDAEKCDGFFTKFLSEIDKGIYDLDGNYIAIELGEAQWVSDKDSILKSSMAVQLPVTFHGGIYKDYNYKDVVPHVYIGKRDDINGKC